MKFYTFGNKENKTFLLLPTRFISWDKLFENVIGLLSKDYYVIVASYDGFDKTEKSNFISIIDEVKKIENYIATTFDGKIYCCYASSFGSKILSKIIERDNLKIENVIFGSPEFEHHLIIYSKLKAKILTKKCFKLLNSGKISDFEEFLIESKKNSYFKKTLDLMGYKTKDYSFVLFDSIYNELYTDYRTSIKSKVNRSKKVNVFIFFSMKMGKKYLNRYVKYFENPDIIYQNYESEELLISYPDKWIQEVKNCLK